MKCLIALLLVVVFHPFSLHCGVEIIWFVPSLINMFVNMSYSCLLLCYIIFC